MRTAAALQLLLLAALAAGALGARIAASTTSPLGKKNIPQLILFTHDDDVSSASSKVVLGLSESFRNPNGCKMPVTWFACTKGCSFSCSEAKKLYKKGHELASHTVHHFDLRELSKSKIREEIVDNVKAIAKCGVPEKSIKGFRAPYLSDKPEVRQVLFEEGFRYDSTVGARGGRDRQWPATMDAGMPYDCSQGGQQCSKSERLPGFFEVPLYQTSSGNLMDYCTDESSGRPRDGCSAYDTLRRQFDDAYGSNRGPVQILIHTPYLQRKQYYDDVKKFLAYAQKKKDVWGVTMSQLLDWMESPVGPEGMPAFMARYTCDK